MSAEEVLRASEQAALGNNQIISNVTGAGGRGTIGKKVKSFGAVGFIMVVILLAVMSIGAASLIPAAIGERLMEETDVQYADAVESKKLVFQQAMYEGDIPENTKELLQQDGVETEKAENGEIVLKMGSKTITADTFVDEVSNNVTLYKAFNNATYSRAAYYYDESAQEVFKRLGATRNNYSADSDFDEVMEAIMGEGSNIDVNNVSSVAKENEEGEVYYEYVANGATAKSSDAAASFVANVGAKNVAGSTTEATLNSADTLKVADTISKEQRSSRFFLGFMENVSKMKAGEGNSAKINEAMNYLNESCETEVVDVATGEVKTVKGTALESPSLYAILTGDKVNLTEAGDYSSDRILKTVENRLGVDNNSGAIAGTMASSGANVKGSIGRFLNIGTAGASQDILGVANQTIHRSLVDNSYKSIRGINAGEFLVEGAVNVGKELAKASGATAGDATAVSSYARLNNTVIAMDAAADRMNRSPFDITSRNTFLGSIMYKIVITSGKFTQAGPLSSGVKTLASMTTAAIATLAPASRADSAEGYLTQYGDCETYATIGAVGSAHCSEVATFDTSTLNNIFNDEGFVAFVNNNTTLNGSGVRTINRNSQLADFIIYNNERITPLGVIDGGILDSLNSDSSSVGFISDIVKMIETLFGSSEGDKRIASGAAYVNSVSNGDWQTYKYAQRYVSLARATDSLRQYAGESTAYSKIRFFEGDVNPVVAFVKDYYAANR